MSFNKETSPPPPPPPYPGTTTLTIVSERPYVNDYLPWSILNLFLGWGFFGVIPLVFSIICRNYKNTNNFIGAQTMSSLALTFNLLITLGGLIGWIVFIVLIYIYVIAVDNLT
ncbi:hypothetical protein I4U23_025141 [Adineta vaga]|nr:hypothetical protein I4U23_025141 [Adineta vaga]